VLGRRVRTPEGEIDLVAARSGELAALEVKTSRSAGPLLYRPADRFGRAARRRQERALAWLAERLGHRGTRSLILCEVFAPRGPGEPRVRFERVGSRPPQRADFHPGPPRGR
jgi:hypothetical protein